MRFRRFTNSAPLVSRPGVGFALWRRAQSIKRKSTKLSIVQNRRRRSQNRSTNLDIRRPWLPDKPGLRRPSSVIPPCPAVSLGVAPRPFRSRRDDSSGTPMIQGIPLFAGSKSDRSRTPRPSRVGKKAGQAAKCWSCLACELSQSTTPTCLMEVCGRQLTASRHYVVICFFCCLPRSPCGC